MTTTDFVPFPSIARLSRDMIVTEKLDGTNAQVEVRRLDRVPSALDPDSGRLVIADDFPFMVCAGSRNRWLTLQQDNFGFCRWVFDHAGELVTLGEGRHYGEWWGRGIQRGYGLDEKRFSLFNVRRWGAERPACCHVVPVLLTETFDTRRVDDALTELERTGSVAAPGFMKPEGVVVFHVKSGQLFKKTLDKNDGHKGAV